MILMEAGFGIIIIIRQVDVGEKGHDEVPHVLLVQDGGAYHCLHLLHALRGVQLDIIHPSSVRAIWCCINRALTSSIILPVMIHSSHPERRSLYNVVSFCSFLTRIEASWPAE